MITMMPTSTDSTPPSTQPLPSRGDESMAHCGVAWNCFCYNYHIIIITIMIMIITSIIAMIMIIVSIMIMIMIITSIIIIIIPNIISPVYAVWCIHPLPKRFPRSSWSEWWLWSLISMVRVALMILMRKTYQPEVSLRWVSSVSNKGDGVVDHLGTGGHLISSSSPLTPMVIHHTLDLNLPKRTSTDTSI